MPRPCPAQSAGIASVPANEQLFATAFENAPHPMALIAAQDSIVHANRSLCRTLGFTRAELCALSASDIIHPDDRTTEREQRRRLGAADIGRYALISTHPHDNRSARPPLRHSVKTTPPPGIFSFFLCYAAFSFGTLSGSPDRAAVSVS